MSRRDLYVLLVFVDHALREAGGVVVCIEGAVCPLGLKE